MFLNFLIEYDDFSGIKYEEEKICFIAKDTQLIEICYFLNDNIEYELTFNFSDESLASIKQFFGEKEIFLSDCLFKRKQFLEVLISKFVLYIKSINENYLLEFLIDDPFKGILNFK